VDGYSLDDYWLTEYWFTSFYWWPLGLLSSPNINVKYVIRFEDRTNGIENDDRNLVLPEEIRVNAVVEEQRKVVLSESRKYDIG
jgi:hypothetical protein